MSDRTFRRLMAMIAVLGCISVIVLTAVTVRLYHDASIISFIANGR